MNRFSEVWQSGAGILDSGFGEPVTWSRNGRDYEITARVRRNTRTREDMDEFEQFSAAADVLVSVADVFGLATDGEAGLGDQVMIAVAMDSDESEVYVAVEREDYGNGKALFRLRRRNRGQRVSHEQG